MWIQILILGFKGLRKIAIFKILYTGSKSKKAFKIENHFKLTL